jgi:hypothetical protein
MNKTLIPAPAEALPRRSASLPAASGRPPRRLLEAAFVAVVILVFLALQLVYPRLPGNVEGGLLLEQFLAKTIKDLIDKSSVWGLFVSGGFPSQRDFYHSVLMAYLYLPVLYLFSPGWFFAKHWHLFFAVPTFVFTYLFARDAFGRRVASAALLFMLLNPTFEASMRSGGTCVSPMLFFSTGALFLFGRWWTTRQTRYWAAGFFVLGAGMSTYLWFYWLLAGLAAGAVLYARSAVERFRIPPKGWARLAAAGTACFSAGAGLIVYREFFHRLASLRLIGRAVFGSENRHGFLNYFEVLPQRIQLIHEYLSSPGFLFPFRPDFSVVYTRAPSFAWAVWLSFPAIFFFVYKRRLSKRFLLIPLLLGVMILLTPISRPWFDERYLFFLYPLPALMVAAAAAAFLSVRRRAVRAAVLAGLALLTADQARGLKNFYAQMKATGGAGFYTDTIYDLADWLRATEPENVLLCGYWGDEIQSHLDLMVRPTPWNYVCMPDEPAVRRVTDKFRNGDGKGPTILIENLTELTGRFARSPDLEKMLGMSPALVFREDDGTPVYRVFEITPGAARRIADSDARRSSWRT